MEGHRPRCPQVQTCRACNIAGSDKPARPPALQVRLWRGRLQRGIQSTTDRQFSVKSIGGPAASPAAGTNVAGTTATWNSINDRPSIFRGIDWRAGDLAGRRYGCDGDDCNVEFNQRPAANFP